MQGRKKQTTLTLSFKDEEMWIYNEISKHSAKGGWVKDVLAEYIRNQGKEKNLSRDESPPIGNLLDF